MSPAQAILEAWNRESAESKERWRKLQVEAAANEALSAESADTFTTTPTRNHDPARLSRRIPHPFYLSIHPTSATLHII
ncbi:hypothetical protein CYLTODRAFT_490232 [Cylindrobasidium torrendii FP15055 ss-10]|uniref:Uncharacterized protein n=1 Tax=Cylindrobasidium torrendii FP15055 ss-10 TaxID=1314674 RepID=A0A0D7BCL0_9AGAR|nr:hypothetical protein CYLTODRAFT_490232 [Cylindrobasidium torrendii FP15055 ss-10]